MSVFWVNASNTTVFEDSYREIARSASILSPDYKMTEILPRVLDWLQGPSSGRWLMIIDNADDGEVFSCVRSRDQQLFKSSNGMQSCYNVVSNTEICSQYLFSSIYSYLISRASSDYN